MKPLKYWTPEGFEISSYKWNLSEKINKSFKTSGSDNTGFCTYTYNELGFRGDSITKDGFKIMSIGDSNTEGVGVNYNDTWSSQFCNLRPNSVNQNFGMGGRSNDYISRCLLTYYDIIKPDLVLIMYTSPQRREIYTKDNNIEPFMPTNSWGYLKDEEEGKLIQSNLTSLQNNNEDFVNWYKNHLLIKLFLESKKCNWLWNGWMEIPIEFKEFNRFDSNYGNFLDKGADGIHPGPKHNKFYGINLFNHIYLNFREFLDKDLIIKQNLI
jgi:lysophospholipase L1-like esterase